MKKLFSLLFLVGFVFAFAMQSNAQYGSSASPLPIKVNFLHTIYGAAYETYAPYNRVMSKGTGTQVTKMKYFISVKFK